MQGFQWFLKSIGIDLSPDGIREMFSKVTADDVKRIVSELGLNPDEILALPKIVAAKLQQFEVTQNRILELLEQQNERHSRGSIGIDWQPNPGSTTPATAVFAGRDQGSAGHSSSVGGGTNGIDHGGSNPT